MSIEDLQILGSNPVDILGLLNLECKQIPLVLVEEGLVLWTEEVVNSADLQIPGSNPMGT